MADKEMSLQKIQELVKRAVDDSQSWAHARGATSASLGVKGVGGISAGGHVNVEVGEGNVVVYLLAVLVGLVVYYLLQLYKPAMVTKKVGDAVELDKMRAVLLSVIVALVVVLGYHLYVLFA